MVDKELQNIVMVVMVSIKVKIISKDYKNVSIVIFYHLIGEVEILFLTISSIYNEMFKNSHFSVMAALICIFASHGHTWSPKK